MQAINAAATRASFSGSRTGRFRRGVFSTDVFGAADGSRGVAMIVVNRRIEEDR